MNNKDNFPTIEQSLKMIEEKIKFEKKSNKTNKKSFNKKESKSLINLFKRNKDKKKIITKPKEKGNVLLLTKKVDDKGQIIDLQTKKVDVEKKKSQPKRIVEKKEDKEINLTIKDNKNLNKTTELAVIIKKLKGIRDKKLNKNKKSKKNNKEIRKLNETIDLAEDLFKKELLDL